jgi:PEP-CTERM motif
LTNASGIFTGVIGSGGGNTTSNGLVIAKGTEALMGANTFKGPTTVSPTATLTGTGSIAGNLANTGTVRPFDPTTPTGTPGTLKVGGNYSQTGTGSLKIAIGGTASSGTFGRLSVSGTVALAGGLDVDLVNGFLFPQGTSTYDILDYNVGKRSNLAGDFLTVSFNGKACTGSVSDTWLCGAGLSFTENFATLGQLRLVVAETPEPGTFAILAAGLLSLLGLRRRRADVISG